MATATPIVINNKKLKRRIRGLNKPQKQAVLKTLKKPALVIAGAGSGKTSVLTTRVAFLMDQGVKPWNILTVTFTNKAAKEMKERIGQAVGEKKAARVNIGTFHSLAVRWLHQYYSEAGLDQNWVIFDDDDTNKVMKTVLKDLNFEASASMIRLYKGIISTQKNAMITPNRFRDECIATSDDQRTYKVYREYWRRMQRQNALDFDDLLMKMVRMLERDPEVRRKFQKKYHYVMVDEYQDTNECQYRMIKLIVGRKNNLFVVGDDYQSIYGWRGANIEKILGFQKDYPDCKIIKLEQNYRSTKTIVECGNAIMKANPNQMHKTCFSDHQQGELVRKFSGIDDESEASFVAEEIRNLVDSGQYNYGDIAILYRTNVLSRLLEDRFMTHQISYKMVSGFSFYQRAEIKDVLSWIQLAVNPDNDISCERVLNTVSGIGKTTIQAMIKEKRISKKKEIPLYTVLETYKAKMTKTQAAIVSVTDIISRLHHIYSVGTSVTETPVSDMLDLVLKNTGYIDRLLEEATDESTERVANVRELVKIAKGYEEVAAEPNLQEFLDQIALASQTDGIDDGNAVNLMTLHSAKGLEYPVVFVIGVEEGMLPHSNSLGRDEELVYEERRLMYVGITRAKELLYLTHAFRRMRWDRRYENMDESRFFEELPGHLITAV
ncbi:ATP-dependent helicase (plasmid) [Paenibacillus sp. EC2-1]|uniref:ATP-dependent helicase n=1 Tax=Paenibacillus sp. EC2-1 TaxID=3388665 RepID=UPI003BEF1D26